MTGQAWRNCFRHQDSPAFQAGRIISLCLCQRDRPCCGRMILSSVFQPLPFATTPFAPAFCIQHSFLLPLGFLFVEIFVSYLGPVFLGSSISCRTTRPLPLHSHATSSIPDSPDSSRNTDTWKPRRTGRLDDSIHPRIPFSAACHTPHIAERPSYTVRADIHARRAPNTDSKQASAISRHATSITGSDGPIPQPRRIYRAAIIGRHGCRRTCLAGNPRRRRRHP